MRLVPPSVVRVTSGCALTAFILVLSGCQSSPFKHHAEKKAVNKFAAALTGQEPAKVRELASSSFSETALSNEVTIEEVKRMLSLQGKLEIVSVVEIPEEDRRSPNVPEKLVTVKDERGASSDHRLVRDPKRNRWVVDEILITRSQRGVTVTKTISEQIVFMALVREFSDAWETGDRDQRLAHVTPECRKELEPLPDEVLEILAQRMFPAEGRTADPEATMDGDIAYVRLRRPAGAVVLQMKRIDGQWLVDDAGLDGSQESENIPSLRKTAVAYAAATTFLAAYNARDKAILKNVSTNSFFDSTLKVADLASVPLPSESAGKSGQFKVVGRQAELIISQDDRTVKLALVRADEEQDVHATTEFRVEDVTIYENGGKVKMRLAAALVAEPIAKLFADALIARDLSQLQVMATHDFDVQVWQALTPELVKALPLDEFNPGEREILSVIHNGASTEVTMMQSGRAMTFVLRDEGGVVKVDDVLVAVSPERPSSLKTTLVPLLPVLRLKNALAANNLQDVRQNCTNDFNRLIWTQVRQVPPAALAAARFIDGPLSSLEATDEEATVRLGDPNYGGTVTLLKHNGQWKVSDLTVIAGPRPSDQAAIKQMLRDGLANGTLFAETGPSGAPRRTAEEAAPVRQVGYNAASLQGNQNEPHPLSLDPGSEPSPILGEKMIQQSPSPGSEPIPPTDDSALPFSEPLWKSR